MGTRLSSEASPCHFLLKCLYQARRMIGHVYVSNKAMLLKKDYYKRKVMGRISIRNIVFDLKYSTKKKQQTYCFDVISTTYKE